MIQIFMVHAAEPLPKSDRHKEYTTLPTAPMFHELHRFHERTVPYVGHTCQEIFFRASLLCLQVGQEGPILPSALEPAAHSLLSQVSLSILLCGHQSCPDHQPVMFRQPDGQVLGGGVGIGQAASAEEEAFPNRQREALLAVRAARFARFSA